MLYDGFVPLIMSQVLGCEVSSISHQYIERNKWLSVLHGVSSRWDHKLWGPQVVRADCNRFIRIRHGIKWAPVSLSYMVTQLM